MLKRYNNNKLICGCDEAGRGALAGPVVASAVILKKKFHHPKLNDSKKISEKTRDLLAEYIKDQCLYWAIGIVDVKKIDHINILNASIKAMHIAIKKMISRMDTKPNLLIIDGNKFEPYQGIKHQCIIKGDSKYASIAAASILAKTHRDSIMCKLHKKYPTYNWKRNKGYPTQEHKKQIMYNSITEHHRKSFKLLEKQYSLEI